MMWLRITGALRALLCLAVGGWLLRDRRPWPATSAWHPWPGRKRKGMVVATLVIAALLGIYLLISPNHLRRSVHLRDTYHYYLGAKYFTELGYRGLYDCSLAADIEAGLGGDLSSRLIRNLETNKMEPVGRALARIQACRRRFEPGRWAMFASDVSLFRGGRSGGTWHSYQVDHGFNASPAWIMVGKLLTFSGKATPVELSLCAAMDFILLALMWMLVLRAMGWRTTLAAGAFWLGNFPGRPYWTLGAFLRQPWLFCSVGGICGLHQGYHLMAGAALGTAALLRGFPAVLLFGPLLNMVRSLVGRRRPRLARAERRFLVGLGLAVALLVPASTLITGGPEVWGAWVSKLRTHLATPSTNNMGLRVVASYSPRTRAARLLSPGAPDILGSWRAARQQVFKSRRPGFLLLVGLYCLLLGRAVWGREPWHAAILSIGLFPVATASSCYYYALLLGYGLAASRWRKVAAGLNLYASMGWLMVWLFPNMDEYYTGLSALSVLFVVGVTGWAAMNNEAEGAS